jgi:hypothetical protein
MRRVLPGGATLAGGDERPVAIRPGAAVVERSRPCQPPDPPKAAAGQATNKPIADSLPAKLQEQISQEPQPEVPRKGSASRLRENIEKVVIAVLTAIILAWLGLNK